MKPEEKKTIDDLANAWEEFKSTNDARLTELEKKGAADPLLEDKLEKINKAMDAQQEELKKLETAVSRPSGMEAGQKADDNQIEYKKAFDSYIRKGHESEILTTKAMSVNSNEDGGFLVTPEMSSMMIKKVFETSPMRNIASVETISSDSLDILVDNDEAAAGWVGETASRSDTDTPKFDKKSIPTHEMYAQPKATQKLIDDAAVNIETWLAEKVSEIFSRTENAAFVSGNGVGKPRGILTYDAGTAWGQVEQINSGDANLLTDDGLVKLVYAVKPEYLTGARGTFLMNRTTVQAARLLKDGQDRYIWQPGLSAGAPDTILGYAVEQATDMPTVTANALSVAFGNFERGYKIVDRLGIRVLRDPFTDKPFVKFYTTKRVGGDVTNFECIKLLKIAA